MLWVSFAMMVLAVLVGVEMGGQLSREGRDASREREVLVDGLTRAERRFAYDAAVVADRYRNDPASADESATVDCSVSAADVLQCIELVAGVRDVPLGGALPAAADLTSLDAGGAVAGTRARHRSEAGSFDLRVVPELAAALGSADRLQSRGAVVVRSLETRSAATGFLDAGGLRVVAAGGELAASDHAWYEERGDPVAARFAADASRIVSEVSRARLGRADDARWALTREKVDERSTLQIADEAGVLRDVFAAGPEPSYRAAPAQWTGGAELDASDDWGVPCRWSGCWTAVDPLLTSQGWRSARVRDDTVFASGLDESHARGGRVFAWNATGVVLGALTAARDSSAPGATARVPYGLCAGAAPPSFCVRLVPAPGTLARMRAHCAGPFAPPASAPGWCVSVALGP